MAGQFGTPAPPTMQPNRPPLPMSHYTPVMGAHPHMPPYAQPNFPTSGFRPPPFGAVGHNPAPPAPPAEKQETNNGHKKRAFMIDTLSVKSKLAENSAAKNNTEEPKLGKRATKKSQLDSMLLMEDLLSDSKFYGNLYPADPNQGRYSENPEAIKFTEVLREMKEQPSKYFNFGFNMQDYLSFVAKHYFVRLERNIIMHSAENFGKSGVAGASGNAEYSRASSALSNSSLNQYSENFTQNYQKAASTLSYQSTPPAPSKL